MVQCGTENDTDCVRSHGLSIEVAVRSNFHACVRSNFWSGLYDILGGITSSKGTLDFGKDIKIDTIRSWNIR